MQTANAVTSQETYSVPPKQLHNKCSDCSRVRVCLANTLEGEDLAAFDAIVKHSKKLNRGDFLYQAGDKFESIYVIRSGSIKTFIDDEEGPPFRQEFLNIAEAQRESLV